MEGGTDAGIGVCAVQKAHQPGEHIVPGEGLRSQLLAGGKGHIDNHRHQLADDKKDLHPPEALYPVQKKVPQRAGDKQEPPHIGKDKNLLKGNPIIQEHMHGGTPLRRHQQLR